MGELLKTSGDVLPIEMSVNACKTIDMSIDEKGNSDLVDGLQIMQALQTVFSELNLKPFFFESEHESGFAWFPYLKSPAGEKVYRLNGTEIKSKIFDDPIMREQWIYKAGILGVPFDALVSRAADFFIEYALNESPADKIRILNELDKDPRLKGSTVFQYIDDEGRNCHRIYRFKEKDSIQSRDQSVIHYRKGGRSLDLRLKLPSKIHSAIFSKASKKKLFVDFTVRHFVEGLFFQVLESNSIPFDLGPLPPNESLIKGIQESLAMIHKLHKWKPYDWTTPVTLHSPQELDNQFLTYSFLTDQVHPSLSSYDDNLQVERIEILYPYVNQTDIFDPFRDFLPYIEKRFWRTANGLFSLFILQFIKAHNLYDFAFERIADDFDDRFVTEARKIVKK